MLKIYIAGPMRGIPQFNFPAFDRARDILLEAGFDPVSPADLDRDAGFDELLFPDDPQYDWIDLSRFRRAGKPFDLHEALDRDIDALKQCDAIYLLKGWENSKGATAERAIANWLGLSEFHEGKDLFYCQKRFFPVESSPSSTITNAEGGKQSYIAARFDCIPPECQKLLAECLGFGARKYGTENWRKIPVTDHIAHALNHLNEYRRGDNTEMHLVNTLARVNMALSLLVQSGQHGDTYTHPDIQEA